jgi:hypothetical protein
MRRKNPTVSHLVRTFVLLLALFFFSRGQADECAQLAKPSVTLKLLEERITLNTQYGYKQLTHLGSAVARPGHQVLGLTRGNAVAQFVSSTPLYTDQSGRWECASPQLALFLGFSPLIVYVAKEFPEGSCAYQEIYQHELRHVKAYQKHLAKIEQEVTDTLNRRFAGELPWRGPLGQTRARLQKELDERWLPYIQRELSKVNAEHGLIDTAEEYERIADSCNGAIRKHTL